jgi:endonuclease V-like protein UPF0215 family
VGQTGPILAPHGVPYISIGGRDGTENLVTCQKKKNAIVSRIFLASSIYVQGFNFKSCFVGHVSGFVQHELVEDV